MKCFMIYNEDEPIFMFFVDEENAHAFKMKDTNAEIIEMTFRDEFSVEEALKRMQELHGKLN